MKKPILLLLAFVIFTYLFSQDFQINKIGEIAYAQGNTDSESIHLLKLLGRK